MEFRIAIRVQPDNGEYLRGLGWGLFNGGDKSQGLEYLHKANEFEPSNVNVLLDLANAYLIMFDFDKAKIFVSRALRIDPENMLAQEVNKKIKGIQEMLRRSKGGGPKIGSIYFSFSATSLAFS